MCSSGFPFLMRKESNDCFYFSTLNLNGHQLIFGQKNKKIDLVVTRSSFFYAWRPSGIKSF
jgi:hypothetical protein